MCVFVLLDSRHNVLKADDEFMEWLGEKGIPFSIIFTKTDKLTSSKLNKNLLAYKKEMLKYWEEMPISFATSSTGKAGKENILNYIGSINEGYAKKNKPL